MTTWSQIARLTGRVTLFSLSLLCTIVAPGLPTLPTLGDTHVLCAHDSLQRAASRLDGICMLTDFGCCCSVPSFGYSQLWGPPFFSLGKDSSNVKVVEGGKRAAFVRHDRNK